jgi:AcrR family transcriptional regulator
LHTQGYATTTTLLVAQRAGLSRGAMLHQFPTRVDLMTFVVKTVFDDEVAIYDARLEAIDQCGRRADPGHSRSPSDAKVVGRVVAAPRAAKAPCVASKSTPMTPWSCPSRSISK